MYKESDWIFPLLVELNSRKDLPALVFMFSRKGCEKEASNVGQKLLTISRKSQVVPEHLEISKKLAAAIKSDKRNSEDQSQFFPEPPAKNLPLPPDCTFAGLCDGKEQEYWLGRIRNKGGLYKLLKFGIGVHHAGLPRDYKAAVEALFRLGMLKVVFATATLALGISNIFISPVFTFQICQQRLWCLFMIAPI